MSDLSALFPPHERTDGGTSLPRDARGALEQLVGGGRRVVSGARSSSVAALTRRVGPADEWNPGEQVADLSHLVGGEPIARRLPASDNAQALAERVGMTDTVDERGWQPPELAKPARRSLSDRRRRLGSISLFSVVVAVVAVAALCGSAALAVVQGVTSDPAAEVARSLREREADLRNEMQVLATAQGLYSDSLDEASALNSAAGGVVGELTGLVDPAALDSVNRARSSLTEVVAGAPAITVPEYRRPPVDEGSLESLSAALEAVRVARDALPRLISQVRTSRSDVLADVSALREQLRTLGGPIEASASQESRSNSAAGDAFRAAVTDAATRVRASHEAGGDGLADMSGFAAAVIALRAENERVLASRRSGGSSPVTRAPYVPGVSAPSGPGLTPPTSGSGDPTPGPVAPSEPGSDGGDPGGGSEPAPTGDPSASPVTGLLPTP